MEYRDLFDKNRKPLGEKIAKGEKFDEGKFIVVVMVFIENSKGEILLQKRSQAKGGKWATTGGHPTLGQSSLEGMLAELKEEIGVQVKPSELVLFKTMKTPKTFVDLYYLHKDIDIKTTKLQESEVQDIGWFTKPEIENLVKSGQFFMPHYQGAYTEYLKLDFMEYKVLEEKDLPLMKEILEDDNMVFDLKMLKKFYEDKNAIGFIAKYKSKIIGFLYGYDIIHPNGEHAFFIYSVGILPEYQNKGYGTKLLEFVKNYAKQHGFFEMFVITDKGNPRACHVYEKLGGKNDYEDEIVYVYNLSKDKK